MEINAKGTYIVCMHAYCQIIGKSPKMNLGNKSFNPFVPKVNHTRCTLVCALLRFPAERTQLSILSILQLMFNNCRQYNEEGSMIYEDANKLEEVLVEKVREMGLSSIMTATTATPAVATVSLTQSETSGARRTVERRV